MMANQQDDNSVKTSEANGEGRLFRIIFFPPSYEVRGYGTEDVMLLLRKTWWIMILVMIIIILVIICMKDGIAVIISGVISNLLKNKSS